MGPQGCAESSVNVTGKVFQSAFYRLLTDVCGETYYQGFADVLEIVCIANLNRRLFFDQSKQEKLQTQFQAMTSQSKELVENELVPLKQQNIVYVFRDYGLLLSECTYIIQHYYTNGLADIEAIYKQVDAVLQEVQRINKHVYSQII